EHEVHAALGQVLEHRVLLGDADRVVRGEEGGRGGQDEPLGQGGDVGRPRGGRGGEERRDAVFADAEDVHADLFGLAGDLDDRVDPFRFGGRLAGDGVARDVADREDSELHRGSCSPAVAGRCSRVGVHAFAYTLTTARLWVFPG